MLYYVGASSKLDPVDFSNKYAHFLRVNKNNCNFGDNLKTYSNEITIFLKWVTLNKITLYVILDYISVNKISPIPVTLEQLSDLLRLSG